MKIKKWSLLSIASVVISVLMSPHASAATDAEIDKMTTYAVILGRATGCGFDVTAASHRVGKWMDQVFPPGSTDQQVYLPIFVDGMAYHAQQQISGKSPDSCSSLRRTFDSMPWP